MPIFTGLYSPVDFWWHQVILNSWFKLGSYGPRKESTNRYVLLRKCLFCIGVYSPFVSHLISVCFLSCRSGLHFLDIPLYNYRHFTYRFQNSHCFAAAISFPDTVRHLVIPWPSKGWHTKALCHEAYVAWFSLSPQVCVSRTESTSLHPGWGTQSRLTICLHLQCSTWQWMFSIWCLSIWGCGSYLQLRSRGSCSRDCDSLYRVNMCQEDGIRKELSGSVHCPQAPPLFLLRDIIIAPQGSPRVKG